MTDRPITLFVIVVVAILVPTLIVAAVKAREQERDEMACLAMGYPVAVRFKASPHLYCGHAEDGAVFVRAERITR